MVDFFKSNNQQQQSGNQQQQQQQPLAGTQQNIQQNQQTQQGALVKDTPPAPLESFKGLWETDPNKAAGDKPKGILPEITVEQLSETLAKSNFLSSVDPELMAKAAGGDSAAFGEVINTGLRNVLAQSVLASRGLVETGTRNHGEQLRTSLPSMVRSSTVQDSLSGNPLFSNPQAKPMVDMVRSQLEAKHPQASSKEIADMTQAFVSDFAKLATPQQSQQIEKGKTATGDTDWFQVLGLDAVQQ